MMSVDKVSPDMGLLDEPIMPTKFPETVAKKNPMINMTMPATMAIMA